MISIHAPREGGDLCPNQARKGAIMISIHAPREGGDLCPNQARKGAIMISIHAPREGGDCSFPCPKGVTYKFQSTPPARGATSGIPGFPRERGISIHAPREGGDL